MANSLYDLEKPIREKFPAMRVYHWREVEEMRNTIARMFGSRMDDPLIAEFMAKFAKPVDTLNG